MLAVLDCKKIETPKIECIFTSEEETTMKGAINLDLNNIESNRIISLDNGKEGKILVSSAECNEWKGKIKYTTNKNSEAGFEIIYDNFKGGHSGGNIGDERRGNPIKLGIEIISKLKDTKIAYIEGGSRVNVIPRNVCIKFVTNDINAKNIIEEEIKKQREFFGENVIIKFNEDKDIAETIDEKTSNKIIKFIQEFQNGAIEKDGKGNVLQSGNMAKITTNKEYIEIEFSERSNVQKYEDEYLKKLEELIKKYAIEIVWKQNLKGVPKKENNILANKCKEVYKDLFNEEMEEVISQGVVEGGFFISKKKNCEYICIGPNTYDVHSPSERLSIKSTKKMWKFVKELLNRI